MTQAWDFVDASILWQAYRTQQERAKIFISKSVREIDWGPGGTRITNIFLNADIKTVADLLGFTQAQLMRMPNVGRKSLRQIKAVLDGYGLPFGLLADRYWKRRCRWCEMPITDSNRDAPCKYCGSDTVDEFSGQLPSTP